MFEFTQGDIIAYLRGNQWLVQNGYTPKYHAVLCDPPYGIEFMGSEWDKPKPSAARIGNGGNTSRPGNIGINTPQAYVAGYDFQAWVTEWASLMLDYVYPGAVGMFFGGTRTFHRLACGLEDAGWEVVDCIMYLYGSGFPKSLDVSKAIDKADGVEREVIGKSPYYTPGRTTDNHRVGQNGAIHGRAYSDEEYEKYTAPRDRNITAPATDAAKRFAGFGTALKPMYEPVILARAPRHPYTFAQLAQQFGSGALNVDGGRIAYSDNVSYKQRTGFDATPDGTTFSNRITAHTRPDEYTSPLGRFPGNVALVHTDTCTPDKCADDCVVALLDAQAGELTNGHFPASGKVGQSSVYGNFNGLNQEDRYTESGGASRFFYTAKSSTFERTAGLPKRSSHPTLKPIQLIEWLSTLLLPPKLDTPRRLLVPFAGVASEMIGAHLAGWDVIHGIEQSGAYIAEGKQRAAWWSKYDSYDKAAASYAVLQEVKQEEAARKAANVEQLRLFGEDVA